MSEAKRLLDKVSNKVEANLDKEVRKKLQKALDGVLAVIKDYNMKETWMKGTIYINLLGKSNIPAASWEIRDLDVWED